MSERERVSERVKDGELKERERERACYPADYGHHRTPSALLFTQYAAHHLANLMFAVILV